MNNYVPIIATLTVAAVGWVMMAFERRNNSKLRRRLEELEEAEKKRGTEALVAATAYGRDDLSVVPLAEEDIELNEEIARVRTEMEAMEQARLLGAEDQHLLALKEELEELRKGIQEDLARISPPSSGTLSPISNTPTHSMEPFNREDSLSEPRSPLLGTPSPKTYASSANNDQLLNTRSGNSSFNIVAMSMPSTSGTITPLSPRSPHYIATEDDESWLCETPNSPSGASLLSEPTPTVASPTPLRRPEVAVSPPLPPLNLLHNANVGGLDAALKAAFEDGSMDLDEWENDEEWLLKTARPKEKVVVRPLPKVTVPRLNLNLNGAAAVGTGSSLSSPAFRVNLSARNGGFTAGKSTSRQSARSPLTISARNGIGSARNTARRQEQTYSSRFAQATARKSTSPHLMPGSKRPSSSPRGSPASARGSPPMLFTRGASASARKETPTPRLVPLSKKFETVAGTPRSGLRRSPSVLSTSSVSTEGESSRPPTKIPRLQQVASSPLRNSS